MGADRRQGRHLGAQQCRVPLLDLRIVEVVEVRLVGEVPVHLERRVPGCERPVDSGGGVHIALAELCVLHAVDIERAAPRPLRLDTADVGVAEARLVAAGQIGRQHVEVGGLQHAVGRGHVLQHERAPGGGRGAHLFHPPGERRGRVRGREARHLQHQVGGRWCGRRVCPTAHRGHSAGEAQGGADHGGDATDRAAAPAVLSHDVLLSSGLLVHAVLQCRHMVVRG